MPVLDDKMRVALDQLVRAQQLIFSGINELRAQSYAVEAANLESILISLKAETIAAIQAVNLP